MVLDSFYNKQLNFRKGLTYFGHFILLEGLNRMHGANFTLSSVMDQDIVYKKVLSYIVWGLWTVTQTELLLNSKR